VEKSLIVSAQQKKISDPLKGQDEEICDIGEEAA